MKNKEKEVDEGIDFSEEAFNRRFRRVGIEELPEAVRLRREAALRKTKQRVKIYFDADIVKRFKELGEEEGVGYQTLMNEALRRSVGPSSPTTESTDLKESILKDKRFLKKLKSALAS